MQTRRQSLIESIINTSCAFGISYLVALFVFPLFFPEQATAVKAFWITVIYTVLSVARNYLLRRIFNSFNLKKIEKDVERIVVDTLGNDKFNEKHPLISKPSHDLPWKSFYHGKSDSFPETEAASNGQPWVLKILHEDGHRFLNGQDYFNFEKGGWLCLRDNEQQYVTAYIDPIDFMRKRHDR